MYFPVLEDTLIESFTYQVRFNEEDIKWHFCTVTSTPMCWVSPHQ